MPSRAEEAAPASTEAATSEPTTAAGSATTTATHSTGSAPGSAAGTLRLFSEAERLAKAQVGCELARTGAVVGPNHRVTGAGGGVESAPSSHHDIAPRGARTGESRSIVVIGSTVEVHARRDS